MRERPQCYGAHSETAQRLSSNDALHRVVWIAAPQDGTHRQALSRFYYVPGEKGL